MNVGSRLLALSAARTLSIDLFDLLICLYFAMPANWKTCDIGTAGTIAEAEDINIAKIDTRLHSMFQALGVHRRTMARMGQLDVTTVMALHTLVDDRKGLRKFLKTGFDMDGETDVDHMIEAGKVVSAWEQSAKRVEVENTRDAVRLADNLPPQITGEDVLMLKKRFEHDHNKKKPISKSLVPSKPYLELKLGHAESLWQAEKLTEVTSLAQQERHALSNHPTRKEWTLDDGDTISFKVPTKPFGIPMPKDSEELRARLKLIGTTFQFLKLKFPQKGVLSTCTKAVFDEYIDWLFGEEIWGFTTKGPDGRPAACPHQGIVESFELACREKVAEHMSEGVDIAAAFELVMEDRDLRNIAFYCYFTTEVTSAKCKALSAPAFRDLYGAASSSSTVPPKRASTETSHDGLSARQRKRAKVSEKKRAAEAAATKPPPPAGGAGRKPKGGGRKPPPALMNGGVGDQQVKGGGKGKLKQTTTEACSLGAGKPICFAWSNGQACKNNPCTMAHCCQICEATDHRRAQCPQNR